jgi:hypothetical protein
LSEQDEVLSVFAIDVHNHVTVPFALKWFFGFFAVFAGVSYLVIVTWPGKVAAPRTFPFNGLEKELGGLLNSVYPSCSITDNRHGRTQQKRNQTMTSLDGLLEEFCIPKCIYRYSKHHWYTLQTAHTYAKCPLPDIILAIIFAHVTTHLGSFLTSWPSQYTFRRRSSSKPILLSESILQITLGTRPHPQNP